MASTEYALCGVAPRSSYGCLLAVTVQQHRSNERQLIGMQSSPISHLTTSTSIRLTAWDSSRASESRGGPWRCARLHQHAFARFASFDDDYFIRVIRCSARAERTAPRSYMIGCERTLDDPAQHSWRVGGHRLGQGPPKEGGWQLAVEELFGCGMFSVLIATDDGICRRDPRTDQQNSQAGEDLLC